MKIVLFSLYGRSGMIHYASQLANALAKKHEVTVLIPSYTDKEFFDKSVKLLRMDAPTSVVKTAFLSCQPWRFKKVIKKIRALNPEVIHVLDNHPWYLCLLPWLKNIPVVVTQHDVTAHPGEFIRGRITIGVNNYLSKKAIQIIVHGENLKRMMIERGIPEKKLATHPIGDFSIFLRWKSKTVKEEPHTLLFFGRILQYKGLDVLLKAMEIIVKKVPDVKLIIAGEGNLTSYHKQLEKLKTHLEIRNDYIAEREVAPFFQRASIIVLPYREASQSGVVPIAYSFGKPVVVTNVGSLPEVVKNGETGILVPPNKWQPLSTALLKLLKNSKECKRMGKAANTMMRQKLNSEKAVQQLEKLYQTLNTE